jgi:hypothetical protein
MSTAMLYCQFCNAWEIMIKAWILYITDFVTDRNEKTVTVNFQSSCSGF